jgi:hypothetical protein
MRTYPQAIKQDAISGLRRFSDGFPWVDDQKIISSFEKYTEARIAGSKLWSVATSTGRWRTDCLQHKSA